MQAIGFASVDLVAQRELIFKIQGEELKINTERRTLLDQLDKSNLHDRDIEAISDAIDKFNDKYTNYPITNDQINQSANKRNKARLNATRGIPYNKHYEGEFDTVIDRNEKRFK